MSFASMPLYTGDYLRDTRHLSPLKHGVYLLALMHCWDSKEPMPLDEQEAAGICNCRSTDEVEALRYILDRYFVRMDDGWYNKRMAEEVARWEKVSKARSNGGLKSAITRRNKARAGARRKVEDKLKISSTQVEDKSVSLSLSLSPSLSLKKEEKIKPSVQDKPATAGAEIWNAYRTAYAIRYSVDPVRNAKVNSQLKQLSQRLGEDAPAVASFYLSHRGELYVRSLHTTDLLLRDAEKLHTEWKTNRQMSNNLARKADKSIGQGDAYENAVLMLKGDN